MAPMKLMFLLVVVSQVHYVVEGAGRNSIEDLELERQLTILNKSPIKTVQTKEGDIFDCIDIHKQPAFDNPLLKNHKIQMVPSSLPKDLSSFSTGAQPLSKILKPLDCPQGTVPIRRTSKEDLIRAKSFHQSHGAGTIHPLSTDHPGQHGLYVASRDAVGTFYAAQGTINTAAPIVGNGQYSGAQIWVEAGDSTGLNTIQAGWGVAPSLFGDSQTRLIAYWNVDALHKEGCYNLLCTGFVQVDKDFTVGVAMTPISQFQGEQYVLHVTIYQDKDSGDWWLQAGTDEKHIGYWPKSLFNHLNNGATHVAWGGIVKGTSNGPSPQMGNGHLPTGNYNYKEACSVALMKVMKDTHDTWSLDMDDYVFKIDDETACYRMSYNGDTPELGESFLFGGPGGNNCGV